MKCMIQSACKCDIGVDANAFVRSLYQIIILWFHIINEFQLKTHIHLPKRKSSWNNFSVCWATILFSFYLMRSLPMPNQLSWPRSAPMIIKIQSNTGKQCKFYNTSSSSLHGPSYTKACIWVAKQHTQLCCESATIVSFCEFYYWTFFALSLIDLWTKQWTCMPADCKRVLCAYALDSELIRCYKVKISISLFQFRPDRLSRLRVDCGCVDFVLDSVDVGRYFEMPVHSFIKPSVTNGSSIHFYALRILCVRFSRFAYNFE